MSVLSEILVELRRIGDELGAPPLESREQERMPPQPKTEKFVRYEYNEVFVQAQDAITIQCVGSHIFTRRKVGEVVAVDLNERPTKRWRVTFPDGKQLWMYDDEYVILKRNGAFGELQ